MTKIILFLSFWNSFSSTFLVSFEILYQYDKGHIIFFICKLAHMNDTDFFFYHSNKSNLCSSFFLKSFQVAQTNNCEFLTWGVIIIYTQTVLIFVVIVTNYYDKYLYTIIQIKLLMSISTIIGRWIWIINTVISLLWLICK